MFGYFIAFQSWRHLVAGKGGNNTMNEGDDMVVEGRAFDKIISGIHFLVCSATFRFYARESNFIDTVMASVLNAYMYRR